MAARKKVAKTTKPDLKEFLAEIEKRAYEFYRERFENNLPGDHLSDWAAAEKEIKERHNI